MGLSIFYRASTLTRRLRENARLWKQLIEVRIALRPANRILRRHRRAEKYRKLKAFAQGVGRRRLGLASQPPQVDARIKVAVEIAQRREAYTENPMDVPVAQSVAAARRALGLITSQL